LDGRLFAVIGLGIVTVLAGGFGALQYQQTTTLQEKNSSLQSENSQLSTQLQDVNNSYTQLQKELESTKGEKEKITSQYSDLHQDYESVYSESQRLSRVSAELGEENRSLNQELQELLSDMNEQEQEALLTQLKFNEQTEEIIFYRQMEIYNYKTGERIPFYWNIPFQNYYWYRGDVNYHNLPYIGLDETVDYYEQALDTSSDLEPLAEFIREYSGSDDELYANMVMQLTHQFYYNVTDYTKTPIETFVEGSGDCDTLSVFAAGLLKEGGVDSIILVGYAKDSPEEEIGVGHAMIGVNLSEMPDDHSRDSIWHYEYGNDLYYLGEATWADVFTDPTNHVLIGSSIGDQPWSEFSITEVIKA
jgi:hypothetical protein